ncbi:hypothetical protein CONLIGDRAFT_636411, partial [Coniochaeta ligniaria NRRL 30616]
MLKSTYKPSPALSAPLAPGWTEHKAPTGHTYYYNAATGVSTYTRPVATPDPAASYLQHQSVPMVNLSDPNVANAFMAQYNAAANPTPNPSFARGGQDNRDRRPPPQPTDKPKSKVPIPGCEPWLLVYTKYGRRFAYHPEKNASYWRIPEKLMPAVLELDTARIREKAGITTKEGVDGDEKKTEEKEAGGTPTAQNRDDAARARSESRPLEAAEQEKEHDYDSSEYEEVEVTDDEGEEQHEDGHASKRQRTEEREEEQPVEFTEADIAEQLAAMGADEAMEDWEEGDEGLPLSDEDARALFKDLLDDFNINPYSSWEKLIEEGKIYDDARYTVLNTMRARKEAWEEWSREKIKLLREQRAKQEKKDPRIPYMAFLQEKATPKLYWPEFRRKYKKEAPMKDASLSDKDREKWYREHIARLKQPQAALKADLKALLESVPPAQLNGKTNPSHLPDKILLDLRYISLDPKIRDPIVEAYIQTLPPPPEEGEQAEEDEAARKGREDRERRERAMRERERAVAEEKKRLEKKLLYEKAHLREEERELERAMQVGKRGLQSQLGGGQD